jgi:adenosylcobinamide-GDP ribazoletransferase
MIFRTIMAAFQFLTIIPIRTNDKLSQKEVQNSVYFFPFVGALQGLFLALLAFLFLKIISVDITAAFALVFSVLITGGFHQDGLSDTFDALSVPSSGDGKKDREKRLQVMKDSTVGPMGVVAIAVSLLLKYLLLKETLLISNYDRYGVLFLMPVFSKWAIVTGMYHAKGAGKDGLGKVFIENTVLKQVVFATIFILFAGYTVFFTSDYILSALPFGGINTFTLFFFSEAIIVSLACLLLKYLFSKRFGGLTGDSFGAMHEISEIIFLIVALLWR